MHKVKLKFRLEIELKNTNDAIVTLINIFLADMYLRIPLDRVATL